MKKVLLLIAVVAIAMTASAQENIPSVPPPKNIIKAKLPVLPEQPVKIPPKIPATVPGTLMMYTWKFIRWWTTGNIGHSHNGSNIKFLNGNTISCDYYVSDAKALLQSGTYIVHGNNVEITLKKDANVILTAALVYDNNTKTLSGTYSLQVLPITSPPAGYTPGTVSGDIKFEIQ